MTNTTAAGIGPYLIVGITGSLLSIFKVTDGTDPFDTAGDTITFNRAANTVGGANTVLAALSTESLILAGDRIFLNITADELITEPSGVSFTTNDMGAAGLLMIQSAPGAGHGGVPGSGAVWKYDSVGNGIEFNITTGPQIIVRNLEMTGSANHAATSNLLRMTQVGTGGTFVQNCLFHDMASTTASVNVNAMRVASDDVTIDACVFWDITALATNLPRGIHKGGPESNVVVRNCTFNNINDGAALGDGILGNNAAVDILITNCVGWNCGNGVFVGTAFHASSDYNASDDATAPGGSSQTSIGVITNHLVDPTGSPEDFQVLRASALVGAGTALTASVPGPWGGNAGPGKTPNIGADSQTMRGEQLAFVQ
jgi:hypothetical protein